MKMGLLTERYYQPLQGVPFSAQQKTGFMGGEAYRTSYPPGYNPRYTPAMNHAKQRFSLPPLSEYNSQQGDRVIFSGTEGNWHPRY